MSATVIPEKSRANTRSRVKARSSSRARVRAKRSEAVAVKAIIALAVAFVGYFAASLTGHVLAESERRAMIELESSLKTARKSSNELRSRVDGLVSFGALENWADQNGFVAPDSMLRPSLGSTLVASR